MKSWPKPSLPPTLTGDLIELRPLEGHHRDELLCAAEDGELWDSKLTVVPSPTTIDQYVSTALEQRGSGTAMPFVIVKLEAGKIVGSTRYWKMDSSNRKLEIGHT